MQRSEYKLLVENWRSFINEEDSSEENSSQAKTIGDLKKAFKEYKSNKNKKAIVSLLGSLVLDTVPGLSQTKSLLDFFSKVSKTPDKDRKSLGVLKGFDINDSLLKLLDKDLIKSFLSELEKEIAKVPDDTELSKFDFNQLLGQWSKGKNYLIPQAFSDEVTLKTSES